MSNKKQSSIDWLESRIKVLIPDDIGSQLMFKSNLKKAKAMHKEEVQDAYRISPNNELWSNSGIDYYNETFGGGDE